MAGSHIIIRSKSQELKLLRLNVGKSLSGSLRSPGYIIYIIYLDLLKLKIRKQSFKFVIFAKALNLLITKLTIV